MTKTSINTRQKIPKYRIKAKATQMTMQTRGITSIIKLTNSNISASIIATRTPVIPILRPDDPCSALASQVEDRGSDICIWFALGRRCYNSRLVITVPSSVIIGARR